MLLSLDTHPSLPDCWGDLLSLTPEDQHLALVLVIVGSNSSGQSDNELHMRRHCALSTIVTFTQYITDDDLFCAATSHRTSIVSQYELVYYSTVDCRPYAARVIDVRTHTSH